MRIALVLLFLLALAALPGALLPQRSLNQRLVDAVLRRPPDAGAAAGPAQFFGVFAAPWFAAVYLLLMISLVGCLLPRTSSSSAGLRTPPVAMPAQPRPAPARGARSVAEPLADVEERARGRLRGWRVRWSDEPGDVRTVSAETGHLHEVGNLVFHLRCSACSSLRAREALRLRGPGHRPVRGRPVLQHRHPRLRLLPRGPARRRHGPHPFCVRVDDFTATYLANGQPVGLTRRSGSRPPADLAAGTAAWRPATLAVNHPLRTRRQPALPARARLRPALHRHLSGRAAADG